MRSQIAGILVSLLLAPVVCTGAGQGPETSPDGVVFSIHEPAAGQVFLAGGFNGWSETSHAMVEAGDGMWTITVAIQPGRYEYKFVIDGSTWKEDVGNPDWVPDPYGGRNSVVTVLDDGSVATPGSIPGPVPDPVVAMLPGEAKPLHLAILWHQHQPRYLKDPVTGEYLEPWVRVHGIKDYYDMVSILGDYPQMKFTVNLTPVLLSQLIEVIEGYDRYISAGASGEMPGCDMWVRLTLTPPADLTEAEKLMILKNFFRMPWETMLDIYPRFKELAEKKRGDSKEELAASLPDFTDRDWRDLQAWFNLAEFDPDFKEGPVALPGGETVDVSHFIAKGSDFTEEDKAGIIEAQIKILKSVIPIHKHYQDTGQLEVVTCPFYHPILPLLCDTYIAREANSTVDLPSKRFAYPEDAKAQIVMARDFHTDLFGRPPNGMWPAEGSVSEAILPLVSGAGISWLATDEEVLAQSLGTRSLSPLDKYRMHYAGEEDARVAMIFRDHVLSDDIGFRYSKMNGVAAANDMIEKLYIVHTGLQAYDGDYVVPIILDGENAWEHFERDGKDFFHSFYSQVSEASWLVPVTISEFLEMSPPESVLPRLAPGSWIAHNFDTWIGEDEENEAWNHLVTARELIELKRGELSADELEAVMNEMYIAEGSDWFWWYGLDQSSGNDDVFDNAFRGTLRRIYTLAGEHPPDYLDLPIVEGAGVEPSRVITGAVRPGLDGVLTRPDEWDMAGFIDDVEGGAMQQAGGDLIKGLYYGFGENHLWLRADFDMAVAEMGPPVYTMQICFSGPEGMAGNAYVGGRALHERHSFGFPIATRLDLGFHLTTGPGQAYIADGEGGWISEEPEFITETMAADDFLEIGIPLAWLGTSTGDDLRLGVLASNTDGGRDVIPDAGSVALRVPPSGGHAVLKSLSDPAGDDHGPGTYTYPTDAVFVPGAFDVTALEIMLDGEANVIFRVGVSGGLDSPWGGITGYSLQAIDIYLDTDGVAGSGRRELFKGRRARTVPQHAWEYFIRACMDTVAMYDMTGARLEDVVVKSYPDEASSSIFISFPRDAVAGGDRWNAIVTMLGHDGYSEGQIRPVLSAGEQWYFGGCDDEYLCPAIIDMIVEEGPGQEAQLSFYKQTGEPADLTGIQVDLE